jgi:hypothetical protein
VPKLSDEEMPAMNLSNKKAPYLVMIDTPEDGRLYLRYPLVSFNYNPAICVFGGRIVPCYVNPDSLNGANVFSHGSEAVCKRHRELLGIRVALEIMWEVWQGLLDKHGAANEIGLQIDIVETLRGPSLGAFAMIEKSGKLGSNGVPQKASDYLRNVMAFAHWGAIWKLRKPGKSRLANGGRKPGKIHWEYSAFLINQICGKSFPDLNKRQWTAFTGSTLSKLIERAVKLDVKAGC